ncbi:MAG: 6-carboxytetrahydropterin synthase [Phycisphaerae bacterium]
MDVFEAGVSGWFSASHRLTLLDGTLEPLHGHNWRVTVTYAASRLDGMGVAVDFVALQRRLDQVLRAMHDRHLNDLSPFAARNPSAENVALHVAESLRDFAAGAARLACVEVEEAPGCVARYRPA